MKFVLFLAGLVLLSANGIAAPFRNLDFEEANTNSTFFLPSGLPSFYEGVGPVADLLPGWKLFHGTNQLDTVGYNLHNGPLFTLIDRFFVEGHIEPGLIQAFGIFIDSGDEEFSLFQRGDVPLDSRLLAFSGGLRNIGITLEVTMNDRILGADPTFSGWDITSFAGQTVDLKLSFRGNELAQDWGSRFIADGITINGRIIPEPSSPTLFIWGAMAFSVVGAIRRQRRGG